ncbi:unnamed protein product [Phytophthora lilii]|uniref:Unnamed protein product n=1 Tax=Phytophthora lilii TaxID=2077276 RepID=A0A9W6WNF5_9STRA|nr:unnamed protein product [Phytophthora lilii]
MARGDAHPGDDSSSSGFSSDEDMEDVSDLPSAASFGANVHVEVLDEAEETGQENAQTALNPGAEADSAPANVLPCCREAADLILQSTQPRDLPYEQFSAAIGHVTWHWPSDEPQRLAAYHSLRAELYSSFHSAFPLTEDMYMQWIGDASAGGADVEALKILFEQSKADYWSVSLTLQHLRFLKENGDAKKLEEAMKEAQMTLGRHFARGHEVWALCRELTTEMFNERDGDELQKERAIRDLFCKQMQVPLDQNDLAMSEFRAWSTYNTLDGEAAGSAFEEASKRQSKLFAPLMKKLRGFEARITAAPGTEDAAAPEQAWLQYLNFVKHRVAPLMRNDKAECAPEISRQLVVCLYERAVAVVCLSPTLWSSYLEYLEPDQDGTEKEGKDGSSKLGVARRAVRNVPFDSSAWTELLIEMERKGKSAKEISEFVQTALLSRVNPPMDQFHLLNVLLTWCDSVRRYGSANIEGESLDDMVQQVESLLSGVFADCEQFLTKTFPDFVEGRMRLTEYKAKCLWVLMPPLGPPRSMPAISMKVSKVNKLWKKSLDSPLGDQASTWIAYLEILQRMNAFSVENVRVMVFDEAVKRVKDAPLVLAETWLVFERENGDLPNYIRARRYHAKHRATAQAVSATQVAVAAPRSAHTEGDKKAKNPKKRKANATSERAKQTKSPQKQPAAKRVKSSTSDVKENEASPMDVDETKAAKAEKKQIHKSLTNEHTLFLCNVSKDATQGDIEALFKDIPTLKDVRLVVKTRGDRVKSRGMAYVQFADEVGVEAGLKRDGFLLHGHPLHVERSKPPPASASTPANQPAKQGFWKTDPVTLYVGDLNREGIKEQVTEEQLQTSLQQAMQAAGKLVVVNRVSILKNRHGKLKNYGLVEVAEPSQTEFCLSNAAALQVKLGDQVTMKPSRFSITHILEQQEKQQKQKQQRKSGASTSDNRGAAANKGANAPHTRPSTRLALPTTRSATSLMPRALRRKLAAQANTASKESNEASGAESSSAATVTPKSNEDFRKMLFNK